MSRPPKHYPNGQNREEYEAKRQQGRPKVYSYTGCVLQSVYKCHLNSDDESRQTKFICRSLFQPATLCPRVQRRLAVGHDALSVAGRVLVPACGAREQENRRTHLPVERQQNTKPPGYSFKPTKPQNTYNNYEHLHRGLARALRLGDLSHLSHRASESTPAACVDKDISKEG